MWSTIAFFSVLAVIHYLIWGEFTEANMALPFALIDLAIAAVIVGIIWLAATVFQKIKEKLGGK